jgi:hypothetical protein
MYIYTYIPITLIKYVQGIEDDVSEMEEEDEKLLANAPAPIPLEWLV